MNTTLAEQIANAVLYEGYLLYPYRASALKNQQRWNFGVVYPRNYSENGGEVEPWFIQTQCLVLGRPLTTIDLKVRFLRLVERAVEQNPAFTPVPWQEASECAVALPQIPLAELLAKGVRYRFSFDKDQSTENQVHRSQETIEGIVLVAAEPTESGSSRLTVRIENLTEFALPAGDRHAVLRQSFISTHMILNAGDGEFVSLLDPGEQFREAADSCANIGVWPVLAGEDGSRDTLLSSPIILYDYPRIAPESPGELFDGTEIDEILTLRILTMTDEEKEEMRRTDQRARAILERTESLPPEQFMRLHGVFRGEPFSTGGDA